MGTSARWPVAASCRIRPLRAAPRYGSPAWSWLTRLAGESRHAARYCLKYGVVVLALFGLLSIWQAGGDGPIAPFRSLTPTATLDPCRVSAPRCILAGTDAATRRVTLERPLALLDEVHPPVAAWVRAVEHQGRLRFANQLRAGHEPVGCLAQYDHFRGTLTIAGGLFAEDDGTIATILCHEYRHARQRLPKTIVYALSFVVMAQGDASIIENDAQLFEREAQLAIFGRYQET